MRPAEDIDYGFYNVFSLPKEKTRDFVIHYNCENKLGFISSILEEQLTKG